MRFLSSLILLYLIAFQSGVRGQYKAGDIVITRFNTDSPDGFSFVTLVNIPSGDSLFFSDEGWDPAAGIIGWRNSTEDHLKYISPGLTAGDVVHIDEISSDVFQTGGAGGSVSLARGSGFSLFGGDQIIAYSGGQGLRPDEPVFLTALHADDGASTLSGTNDNETAWTIKGEVDGSTAHSVIPDGLVNGVHAISVFGPNGTEQDNMVYDCSFTSGTKAELLIAVNNASNWSSDNSTNFTSGSACAFSVAEESSTVIFGNEGWRMMSLPVVNGSLQDLADDAPVQGVNGGENSGADANFYYNASSEGSGTTGWATPGSLTEVWGDGLGFIWYFFNNTQNGSNVLPQAIDAGGEEPSTDVEVSLSGTFTLAGNPYQSPIKMDDITANGSGGIGNGLVSPVSVWSDSASSWLSYNFGEGHLINEWTGFFVERSAANPASALTIPVSSKVAGSPQITHSKKGKIQSRSVSLSLKSEQGTDHALRMYFRDQSESGYDGYDGSRLIPLKSKPYAAFLQRRGDQSVLLSQDARPLNPAGEEEFELIIRDGGFGGELLLSWYAFRNIPPDWVISIRDLHTGVEMDMQEIRRYRFQSRSKVRKVLRQFNNRLPELLKATAIDKEKPRFRISLKNTAGTSLSDETAVPFTVKLGDNYPNPFNGQTRIPYEIKQEFRGEFSLSVFNIYGQRIAILAQGAKPAGEYEATWQAGDLASGVYFSRLISTDFVQTKKMSLIK